MNEHSYSHIPQFNTGISGSFGLPAIPILYPTAEEFENPWTYISSIQPIIALSGVCIIEPPSTVWNKNVTLRNIDENVSFPTKMQHIDQLRYREGANAAFMNRLSQYWMGEYGQALVVPKCEGIFIDLYQVKVVLEKYGGVYKIRKTEDWIEIARQMKLNITNVESPSHFIKELYLKYIDPIKDDYVGGLKNWSPRKKRRKSSRLSKKNDKRSPKKRDREEIVDVEEGKKKKRDIKKNEEDPIWAQVRKFSWGPDHDEKLNKKRNMLKMSSSAYEEGDTFTLKTFKAMADTFENTWFNNEVVSHETKETEYWKIVDQAEHNATVYYGSDLDVKNQGTLFPREPSEDSYENYIYQSGWNPNNLAFSTFLHHLGESVAGVTRPMLYVGMCFSSFCWHTEDNFLFSVNYLHGGQGKKWYGIPAYAAEKFEKVMREHLPELFAKTPNLLHLLITMLPPDVLRNCGVPIYSGVQQKGQFIITAPRAYHAGFNLGFNIAESVNFAIETWLPYCKLAVENYRHHRNSVFPYEEFVILASQKPDTYNIAVMLRNALHEIIYSETIFHNCLVKLGLESKEEDSLEETQMCTACGYDCFLSSITCQCSEKIYCIRHFEHCDCDIDTKTLRVRYSIDHLMNIYNNLAETINSWVDTESKAQNLIS